MHEAFVRAEPKAAAQAACSASPVPQCVPLLRLSDGELLDHGAAADYCRLVPVVAEEEVRHCHQEAMEAKGEAEKSNYFWAALALTLPLLWPANERFQRRYAASRRHSLRTKMDLIAD